MTSTDIEAACNEVALKKKGITHVLRYYKASKDN